jgi:TonB family protein
MNTEAIRHDTDWIGKVVDGKFPLRQWIGNSGQGDVFLTELPGSMPQKAAIKLIAAGDPSAESRLAGWSTAKTLAHPHLMRLIDAGKYKINGTALFYAVTEYAEENLSQILPERPLTAAETKDMIEPLIDALAYIHGKGLVHGHLKPSNIMAVNDQLKLSSDGIRAAGGDGKSQTTLTIYDAPERAKSGPSPATDVWSLGITLVETLTQTPPVWDRAKREEPVIPANMPSPFAEIARECLRIDPAVRCTLNDIRARFQPAVPAVTRPVAKPQPVVMPTRTPPPMVKDEPKRFRMAVILGAALLLIVFVGFLTMRSRPTSPVPVAETQQAAPAAEAPTVPSPTPSLGSAKGAVVSQVLPDVPAYAASTIHGTVKVKVKVAVDATGGVSDATLESPGPSRYFSGLALAAARQWKFKPPQLNGKPVSSVWNLAFEFRQSGPAVTSLETDPKL